MASSLLSGSVKHSPAAATAAGYDLSGRATPLRGGNTCRFGFKRPASILLKVPPCSSASSTVAGDKLIAPRPFLPSDFTDSPAPPLLLLPPILLDKNTYQLDSHEDHYFFFSWSKKELLTIEKNQKSWRRNQIRHADDAYWIGSSKGWIMYMNRCDCSLYLCNPFSPSTAPIIPLPPIETLPSVAARNFRRRKSEDDVTDRSSGELDVEYLLKDWYDTTEYYSGYEEDFKACIEEKRKQKWFEVSLPRPPATSSAEDLVNRGFISKMALSSAPNSGSSLEDLRNCIVAIIYGLSQRLAICRLGDSVWTPIDGLYYRDIIFSRHDNSKLLLDTWSGGIKSCQLNVTNLSSSPKWNVIADLDFHKDMTRHFLVESATDPNHLSMVRSSYNFDAMDVHELDLLDAKQKWVQVDWLEDQTLFVGTCSETVTVPAAQFADQVKPNYIYVSNFDCFEVCVYSLEEIGEDLEENDGPGLDLSFKGKQQTWLWEEIFRSIAHGWALWVTPNPW